MAAPSFEDYLERAQHHPGFQGFSKGDLFDAYVRDFGDPRSNGSDIGDFEAGWVTGKENLKSLFYAFAAAAGSGLGDDELAEWGMENYALHSQAAAESGGKVRDFDEIEGVRSFVDWAQFTLGSLGPFALESIGSAIAGAAAGTAGAPGVGTIAGGTAGLLGKETVKRALIAYAKKEATERQAKIAKDALASTGSKLGLVAGNYPLSVGEVFAETDEAGAPSAATAFAVGVPHAAADVAAEAIGIGRVFRPGKGGPVKRIAKAAAAQTPVETLAEGTQEELVLQTRAAIDPEFDLLGPEAMSRRRNAAAAGALGGAAIGGAGGLVRRQAAERQSVPADQSADPSIGPPTTPESGAQTTLDQASGFLQFAAAQQAVPEAAQFPEQAAILGGAYQRARSEIEEAIGQLRQGATPTNDRLGRISNIQNTARYASTFAAEIANAETTDDAIRAVGEGSAIMPQEFARAARRLVLQREIDEENAALEAEEARIAELKARLRGNQERRAEARDVAQQTEQLDEAKRRSFFDALEIARRDKKTRDAERAERDQLARVGRGLRQRDAALDLVDQDPEFDPLGVRTNEEARVLLAQQFPQEARPGRQTPFEGLGSSLGRDLEILRRRIEEGKRRKAAAEKAKKTRAKNRKAKQKAERQKNSDARKLLAFLEQDVGAELETKQQPKVEAPTQKVVAEKADSPALSKRADIKRDLIKAKAQANQQVGDTQKKGKKSSEKTKKLTTTEVSPEEEIVEAQAAEVTEEAREIAAQDRQAQTDFDAVRQELAELAGEKPKPRKKSKAKAKPKENLTEEQRQELAEIESAPEARTEKPGPTGKAILKQEKQKNGSYALKRVTTVRQSDGKLKAEEDAIGTVEHVGTKKWRLSGSGSADGDYTSLKAAREAVNDTLNAVEDAEVDQVNQEGRARSSALAARILARQAGDTRQKLGAILDKVPDEHRSDVVDAFLKGATPEDQLRRARNASARIRFPAKEGASQKEVAEKRESLQEELEKSQRKKLRELKNIQHEVVIGEDTDGDEVSVRVPADKAAKALSQRVDILKKLRACMGGD